ncbi:hypothetical protein [Paenibacillus tundrae]|uniref:hypothetical protein n=1 Tax=Paenibacillus tundrae TaxID=528187 RepID=UPI0027D7AE22|nr:hypothetical protein [Paenibacillus tundrae]
MAGSIILVWTFITISPREIIASTRVVLPYGNEDITSNKTKEIKTKLFEKYLSITGILYIAIGYLIQLIQYDEVINNWIYNYNPINKIIKFQLVSAALLNTVALIVIALLSSLVLRTVIFNKQKNKKQLSPTGEIRIFDE